MRVLELGEREWTASEGFWKRCLDANWPRMMGSVARSIRTTKDELSLLVDDPDQAKRDILIDYVRTVTYVESTPATSLYLAMRRVVSRLSLRRRVKE